MPIMSKHAYDAVIIGSGSSGGTAAYGLQKAGLACLLLEAGHYHTAKTYPRPEADYSAQLFWGGGIEVSQSGRLGFLRGKCVGGSSIINQGLMDRFDSIAFDDWRAESGIDFFTEDAMAPYYDAIESRMTLQYIPESYRNRNALLFIEGMEKAGHKWGVLRRGQCDCGTTDGNDCISCLGGCHRDSKQSSLVVSIRPAEELGLTVWDHTLVARVEHRSGGVQVSGTRNGEPFTVEAPRVILAGGSFGTTEILLRSGFKDKFPALGTRVATHPQFMTFACLDEPVDAHKGAFQSVKSDDADFRRRGFKLENVYGQPIGLSMLFPGFGPELHDFMDGYRYMASMEVALRDEASGEIKLDKKGRMRVHKDLTAQDQARVKDGLGVVRSIYEAIKPKRIVQSKLQFCLHLMGGCAIGTDPKTSVVSPDFQVHDHPNLYCADTSVFPNAPGINPALTTMALTNKMVEGMLR